MDELEVWGRFKAGSEADFALLYQKYAPVLLRYGNKITPDKELIRDSLQQVYLAIWRGRETIGNPVSVKNYLLKSLRHEIIKKLNRNGQHESLPENYHFESEDSHESTLISLQTEELTRQRISELLSRLPARQREVIFLRYYANLKYDEISAIMDIEQESVYKLTYKAIAKLQQFLAKVPLLLLAFFLL